MIPSMITEYGFIYGSSEIDRLMKDEKKGWVVVGLKTPKFLGFDQIQIYVTKTGCITIYGPDKQKFTVSPRKKK